VFSVQASGVALVSDGTGGEFWEKGVEGQIRWTRGAWSLGAGVQFTSGEWINSFSSAYDASTLGFFLEPRVVVGVLGSRVGLYIFGRMSFARISEKEFGPSNGGFSVEGTRNSLAAYLGPGFLIRLGSRVNLDLGITGGYTRWGEADTTGVPPFSSWGDSKGFFVLGGGVGFVIGIG